MFMFDWSAIMTPQKASLDSMRTLSWFISYRHLSPQFQFSLSAAALGIYLHGHKCWRQWEYLLCRCLRLVLIVGSDRVGVTTVKAEKAGAVIRIYIWSSQHLKLSNKTDYPIWCTLYTHYIYSNKLADFPVDDSLISLEMFVDSKWILQFWNVLLL